MRSCIIVAIVDIRGRIWVSALEAAGASAQSDGQFGGCGEGAF